MEFYYTPKHYISSETLAIVDDEAKHLGRVLRKQQGEEIFVTDGEGSVYRCKINSLSKGLIDCNIIEKVSSLNEPKIKINLYQSLIKNPDRFEFAVEKAVELGVYAVHPVITEHVINKTTNKTERWQSIALAAMKQSQRCLLPKIYEPVNFAEALTSSNGELRLIADEKPNELRISISDIQDPFNTIDIFIGPEGGFTAGETELALSHGFKLLALGSRKFRSETAAIYAVSKLI